MAFENPILGRSGADGGMPGRGEQCTECDGENSMVTHGDPLKTEMLVMAAVRGTHPKKV